MIEQQAILFSLVKKQNPLVHCITNYVTANDCANAILAVGGSPIMADYIHEVADIVKKSKALVLNIGTLNENTVSAMILAGKAANYFHVPVVFDPVGAGASAYRNEATRTLLKEVQMSVIRGNLSEMSFIAGASAESKGVDNATNDSNGNAIDVARKLATEYKCVTAITGATDTVSDGANVLRIKNGTAELSRVTGTGCMTTALIGTFCGTIFSDKLRFHINGAEGALREYLHASVAGIACMGIAGEIAFSKTLAEDNKEQFGTGAFHIGIIDALSHMDADIFIEKAKIYEA